MPLSSVNDYKISYEMRPEYLLVRVDLHTNNYNIARQYWTDLERHLHGRRYKAAVVEINAETALPPREGLALMIDFSKRIFPDVRVAIVNRHVAETVRSAVETSAMVEGRSFKVFDSLQGAEEWLREGDDTGTEVPAAIHSEGLDLSYQDLTNRETM
jgi:hypothetical protein